MLMFEFDAVIQVHAETLRDAEKIADSLLTTSPERSLIRVNEDEYPTISLLNDEGEVERNLTRDEIEEMIEQEFNLRTSDVIEMAGGLLDPSELGTTNPEYFRALSELCNRLRGRRADEIELTETEIRKAAQ